MCEAITRGSYWDLTLPGSTTHYHSTSRLFGKCQIRTEPNLSPQVLARQSGSNSGLCFPSHSSAHLKSRELLSGKSLLLLVHLPKTSFRCIPSPSWGWGRGTLFYLENERMRTGYSHLSVKEAGPWSSSKVQDDTATTGQGNPRRPTPSSPAQVTEELVSRRKPWPVPTGTIISVPLAAQTRRPEQGKSWMLTFQLGCLAHWKDCFASE